MEASVAILILAAGASSRMRGSDKLLQEVEGEPLLRHLARAALAASATVMVALSPRFPDRRLVIDDLPLRLINVPDAHLGMGQSLRCGVCDAQARSPEATGLMVLPGDMPEFTGAALADMITAFSDAPNHILRGAALLPDGTWQQGHPAIFPRSLWPALTQVSGDEGGRSVIRAHEDMLRLHPLPGLMAVTDLDTPEDWAVWRGLRRQ